MAYLIKRSKHCVSTNKPDNSVKEFSIIDSFFDNRSYQRKDVLLGIGDDCAVTQIPEGQSLVITTDTILSGVHFPEDTPAQAVAHKAVAVNLSDLAAMGAEPAWLSLSLSLPSADKAWLDAFSGALHELTDYYAVQLIGGDTVQGPLAITITAHGFVPNGQALTRSGAKPGDLVYVTGTLGDAGMGLDIIQNNLQVSRTSNDYLTNRLHYPTPRLLAGTAIRRIANACIDISDGLVPDLQHVLNASECGATVYVDKLPLSIALREACEVSDAYEYALSSGDDYELLFTVSEEQKGNLDIALSNFNIEATCIGQLNGMSGKLDLVLNEQPYQLTRQGYEHFA